MQQPSTNSAIAIAPGRIDGHARLVGILLVIAVLALAWFFLPFPGSPDVPDYWLRWIEAVRHHGLRGGYTLSRSDYPPGSFALFFIVSRVLIESSISDLLTLKYTLFAFSILGGIVFGVWSRSLWKTAGFGFAILLNTSILGYLDALYLPPFLLALIAMQRRCVHLAALFYSCAIVMKWQPLIIAPFLIVQAFRIECHGKWLVNGFVAATSKLLLGAIPVVLLVLATVDREAVVFSLSRALSHQPLSSQALNGNWVIQLFLYFRQGASVPQYYDALAPTALIVVLKLAFWLLYASILTLFTLKSKLYEDFVWFACIAFFAYFCVNIGVHENHMFVALVLAFVLLAIQHEQGFPTACFIGVASNINLLIFYGINGSILPRSTFSVSASVVFSFLNMIFLLMCISWSIARLARK